MRRTIALQLHVRCAIKSFHWPNEKDWEVLVRKSASLHWRPFDNLPRNVNCSNSLFGVRSCENFYLELDVDKKQMLGPPY